MMGLFAIGAAIGSVTASILSKGRSGFHFSTAGIFSAALMVFIVFALSLGGNNTADGDLMTAQQFFQTDRAYLITGAFLLSSVSTSLFVIPMQAAVQRRAPAEKRSRILAANNMMNAGAAWAGFWFVLPITRLSINPVYALLALSLVLSGVGGFMLYRKKTLPAGLYDEMLDR